METQWFGSAGLQVSRYALGAMMFGSWGNRDRAECVSIVHRFLDAGANLVDCADVYSAGEAEEIVGQALAGHRDRVLLATKFHGRMGPGPNDRGASRHWIRRAVEASLRRLHTDHIDLYQLHRPEPEVDLEVLLAAADDLVRSGKVGMFGTSNFAAEDLVDLDWVARDRRLLRPVSAQSPYSVFNRGIEAGVLPTARRLGLGVMVFSPLNGGWLTGKYHPDRSVPPGSRAEVGRIPARFAFDEAGNSRKFELLPDLSKLAEEEGITLTALSLYWAAEHPAVSTVLVGPRTLEQADELLQIIDRQRPLTGATLDAIDTLVLPGAVLNEADNSYRSPALAAGSRRRDHNGR